MATNTYFNNGVTTEQMLYEDLVIEALQIYGQDVIYIPRSIVNYDNLMGEAIASEFSDGYNIEMYLENTEGFDGEGDLFSKFGVEIRDQATLVVSKLRWEKLVGYSNNLINSARPSEGDLIYIPLSNGLFEIVHVEHEQPFYQLAQLPTYKLQIEKFEYANENFSTGIDEIDVLDDNFSYGFKLLVDTGNATDFIAHETAAQTLSSGIVASFDIVTMQDHESDSNKSYVYIDHIRSSDNKYVELASGINIIGADSGAVWNVVEVIEDFGDPFRKNDIFDEDRDDIIDFSESNPFGEI